MSCANLMRNNCFILRKFNMMLLLRISFAHGHVITQFMCVWNHYFILSVRMKPLYGTSRCFTLLRYVITLRYYIILLRHVIELRDYVTLRLINPPTHSFTHGHCTGNPYIRYAITVSCANKIHNNGLMRKFNIILMQRIQFAHAHVIT